MLAVLVAGWPFVTDRRQKLLSANDPIAAVLFPLGDMVDHTDHGVACPPALEAQLFACLPCSCILANSDEAGNPANALQGNEDHGCFFSRNIFDVAAHIGRPSCGSVRRIRW